MKRKNSPVNGKEPKIKRKDSAKKSLVADDVLLCNRCEISGAEVKCNGICKQNFHKKCLEKKVADNFVCDLCSSNKNICFCCKSSDGELKECSVPSCCKFYHVNCLQQFGLVKKDKIVCPQHFCSKCQKQSPNESLLLCLRCPRSYHNQDHCIAAGCKLLSNTDVICPDHFVQDQNKSFQTVVNIPWCSICSINGDLTSCKSCPNSVHPACLSADIKSVYACNSCTTKKQLQNESIVWVKIGSFRWWPARIVTPKDVPKAYMIENPAIGEFPVQYFGTKEYFWTFKTRVHPYFCVTEDSLENGQRLSMLDTKYKISIDEANQALDEWSIVNDTKVDHSAKPQYKHIKVNKPVGKVQIFAPEISSLAKCVCDPESNDPCGYSSDCLNRNVLVECHPNVCKAGEQCQNQLFQKRSYPKIAPCKTETRGWALQTLEDIKEGQFVVEYVGDLIDEKECERRLREKRKINDTNYYYLTLDKDRIIDAGPKGNYSRFMNHSCDPNCETQKWIVNGDYRVGLFAKHDISAGTELTFDYMMDSLDNEKLPCLCGAKYCRGAIGAKNIQSKNAEKKKKSKSKVKGVNHQAAETHGKKFCFLCPKAGKLYKCDFNGCKKMYHLNCLGRKSTPIGRLQCPLHHCATCGRLSEYMCTKCTTAFCEKHKTDENMLLSSGQLLCLKHASDL